MTEYIKKEDVMRAIDIVGSGLSIPNANSREISVLSEIVAAVNGLRTTRISEGIQNTERVIREEPKKEPMDDLEKRLLIMKGTIDGLNMAMKAFKEI